MILNLTARTAAVCLGVAIGIAAATLPAPAQIAPVQPSPPAIPAPPVVAPTKRNVPYRDAKPIWESLRQELIPAELAAMAPAVRSAAWPGWVSRRDAAIRQRVARGDEESLVNFLIFGTTFTSQPRVTQPGDADVLGVIQGRLDDLVTAIAAPGTNERIQFARRLLERRGINAATPDGRVRARQYLAEILTRIADEVEGYNRGLESLQQLSDPRAWSLMVSTFFRERGLSSDTTILPDFGIEQALDEIRRQGLIAPGRVRRVAIVGPGLDFTDKESGYDFYPPQTLQPFAVIDSLIRLKLANPGDLKITTFDVSPRVNQHIEAARRRARAGQGYVLQLPRDNDRGWLPGLTAYWDRFGATIGDAADAAPVPAEVGDVQVRAVRVRPAVVLSITPRDLNIVLQRPIGPPFDLVIATNILVYYDVFEQALAMTNVARMLRPGGLFLSSDLRLELPATPMKMVGFTDVPLSDNKEDRILWYRPR